MALPPLATVDDVELVPGYPAGSNPDTTEALIVLASARVRAYTGCRWANEAGTALEDVPDGVTQIVAGMVNRSLTNPRGVTQESTGPWGASYGSQAANNVYLSGADKEFLDAVGCRSGVSTLSTTRGPVETPTVLEPLDSAVWW